MSIPTLPAPDAEVIHVHGAAGQTGPLSRRAIADRLKRGEFRNEDSFWFDGMGGWVAIKDHPALLELDAAPKDESRDDKLDRIFGGLVKESWSYFNAHSYASQVDEVFLGAIITCTLDTGYSLIDLSSDGTHHYLRFEHLTDHSRIIVRLTHLTADLTKAKVHGHRASVIIGYGERSNDFAKIMNALKAEMKSGYIQTPEPGTITVDGDMNTGYIYVQVDLYLKVDDYVGEKFQINYPALREHLAATQHVLRKYLRGRFA